MYKLIFLFLISCSAYGQLNYEQTIAQKLCSPSLSGRGYVDGGDSLSAIYIASEFEKLGVKPYSDSYFQPFSFDVNTFPNNMEVKLDGKTLRPGVDFEVNPYSGGGEFTRKTRVFNSTSLFDNSFKTAFSECKSGKIIPVFDPSGITDKDTLKMMLVLANDLAQNVCPVAMLQKEKFTWSVEQTKYRYPFLEIQDSIFSEGELAIHIDAVMQHHNTQNIVAYLPATKKQKKLIVLTAHYDHLGKMGKETYFPGGNDNASGTTMLLSLAKELQGKNPTVSYVFIAFAGEEVGLLGSHYYVEHPLFPLKNINFLLNLDIMGSGEEGITAVNATVFPKAFKELETINNNKKYLAAVKKRGPAANSDHYWFTEKGVPCFFFYTMGPNKHYHDVYDTYDELSFAAFYPLRDLIIEFTQNFK